MTAYPKWHRILAFSIACLTLVWSAFAYLELQSFGFPDGHLTELDRAEAILGRVLISISVPVGLWFIFLGSIATRRRISKKLSLTIICYAIFVLLLLVTDLYLRHHLDDGVGG